MIYVYVFPKDGFDRNIADECLKEAFLNKTGVERYTTETFINALNGGSVNPVSLWARTIKDGEECYPISCLYLENLKRLGFDTGKVTESDLLTIADSMNDDYLDWMFWDSLKIIADGMGLPRLNK